MFVTLCKKWLGSVVDKVSRWDSNPRTVKVKVLRTFDLDRLSTRRNQHTKLTMRMHQVGTIKTSLSLKLCNYEVPTHPISFIIPSIFLLATPFPEAED